ncbi:MAG: T9SS type A sorting domain-containing protein [Chitinophagaceae bacterium]
MKSVFIGLVSVAASLCSLQSRAQLTAPANFNLPQNSSPANVSAAECFFDNDPGLGLGTSISITSGTAVSANSVSIRIDTLSTGIHRFYTRVKNTNGSWGMTNEANFFIEPGAKLIPANLTAANVTAVEYFIDNDPGLGQGISIPITSGSDVSANSIAIRVDTFTSGIHRFYTRVENADGSWSMTDEANFFIEPGAKLIPANATTSTITTAEYFVDNDPGLGQGIAIPITPGSNVSANGIAIRVDTFTTGVHRIYTRVKNTNSSWSTTKEANFFIIPKIGLPASAPIGDIVKLEYFFDTDPGFGNGQTLSITPTTNLNSYGFSANISSLQHDTTHTLYLRVDDGWSQTVSTTFNLFRPLPLQIISFTAQLQQDNSVALQWKTSINDNADFFTIQRTTDGISYSGINIKDVRSNSGDGNWYSFVDQNAPSGKVMYRIEQTDKSGQPSYSAIQAVIIPSSKSLFYLVNNPTSSILQVHRSNADVPGQFEILAVDGRLITRVPSSGDVLQRIDISNLPDGTYLLFYNSAEQQQSLKFVKN